MADKPRVYIDACCVIDIAKQSVGAKLTDERKADVWFVRQFLEAHKERNAVVFTSVLTITECLHADGVADDRVKNLFTRFLTSGQYLTLVQPTPFLAADARDLRWRHGIEGVRGADYIHLQSALSTHCREFFTTDAGIAGNAVQLLKLGLHVTIPMKTVLLPDKYRQGSLLDDNKVTKLKPKKNAS